MWLEINLAKITLLMSSLLEYGRGTCRNYLPLVISVITASNSSCLIRKRWHKLLLAIDPLFVCQIRNFCHMDSAELFHSYNSHFWLQPKRKGNREKLLLTSRRIRTHLASREEAESRARSLFSQTSLVVYATAIRVPVIFSVM